jgi:hypothetical protein
MWFCVVSCHILWFTFTKAIFNVLKKKITGGTAVLLTNRLCDAVDGCASKIAALDSRTSFNDRDCRPCLCVLSQFRTIATLQSRMRAHAVLPAQVV